MVYFEKKFAFEKRDLERFFRAKHSRYFKHIYTVVALRVCEPFTKEAERVFKVSVGKRLLKDCTKEYYAGVCLMN